MSSMSASVEELTGIFEDAGERWLLVLGSDWGASSGVPLATMRTRWSPSIADLVRYELFRSHSRDVFHSVEGDIGAPGRPPLGFVADSLKGQREWMEQHLSELQPQKSAFLLADLARHGLFESVISSAPDSLFERALEALEVPYCSYDLESGAGAVEAGSLPILREWDDAIFQDTEDRRSREARFLDLRLNEILQKTDGVLILGHHPEACEVMESLLRRLEEAPPQKLVWVAERSVFSQHVEASREPTSPFRRLAETYPQFLPIQADALGDVLESIAEIRQLEPASYTPSESAGGLSGFLNKTFDIRPVLLYIPGVALFSGLVDRLPELSIRAAISIFALIAVVFGVLNFQTYQRFEKQQKPIRQALDRAQRHVKDGASYQDLLRAKNTTRQLRMALKKFEYPTYGPFTLPFLPGYLARRIDALRDETRRLIRFRLIPQLYRKRLVVLLKSHPQLGSMGHYDELLVREEKLGVVRAHTAAGKARLPRSLKYYNPRPRVVLYYKSAPFLQIAMGKEMLRETAQKRVVVSVDLARAPQSNMTDLIQGQILRVIGGQKEYSKIFDRKTVEELLLGGRVSVYFDRFDTGGSVSNAITRIQAFLSSYPKCRAVIAVSRKTTRKAVLDATKTFVHLSIANYPFNRAYAYLRKKTSYRYVQRVYDNNYLRWNWIDPLIRSLLIDTYHQVGVAPRSIGVLYERLLQTMMSQGRFNFALKFKLLGLLAYESAKGQRPIHKEQTILLIAKALDPNQSTREISNAASVLKEMMDNGVLFYHAKDGVVFSDKRFLYVCLSKYLVQSPLSRKKHLLLRMPLELTAFYAGMSDSVDAVVGGWLADYLAIDQMFRSKRLHLSYANPYLYSLAYAANAIMNGRVSHGLVKRLESILMEQVGHELLPVQAKVAKILTNFPTPRLQEWVRKSVAQNAPHDHRMLAVIAGTSNPIYATPVKRWLRRVCTQGDKQLARRFTKKTRGLPVGQRRLHVYTKWAIGHGLIALAQLGTSDALRIVKGYVLRRKDKRFHQADWNYFRYYAAEALLRNNHSKILHSLYPEFEKNPSMWCFSADRRYYSLFWSLAKLNDRPTARLLVRLLAKQEPLTRAVGQYKNDAATGLARIDDELVYPLLYPIVRKAPAADGPDYRVYAGLVFSYKRKMDAFPLIKPIALQQLKWTPKSKDKKGVGYHSVMMIKTLAGFRTKEALEVVKTLYLDKKWRKHSPVVLLEGLNFFRYPSTEQWIEHRIHCSRAPIADKARLIKVFGMMKNSRLQDKLNRIIRMLIEGPDPHYLRELCGQGEAPKLNGKQRVKLLVGAIHSLAMFGQRNDIARLAEWAKGARNWSLRKAAFLALGNYRDKQASDALTRAYQANPRLIWYYLRALHKQKYRYNADKLLQILSTTKSVQVRRYLLYYLRSAGNVRALRAAYSFQSHKILGGNARWAFFYIAEQLKGKIDERELLEEMIKKTPAAPLRKVSNNRKSRGFLGR